jgi:polysaccharide deacetylase family protein (PEP-CTERM system associated)
MLNALTVDVEDWYQTSALDFGVDRWDSFEDRVVENTRKILRMLEKKSVKGTFFVLGCVAEKHPALVAEIHAAGHEIGSHGGWHRLLTTLTPDEFRDDLLYSKRVLEQITGSPVRLYRAPSWSITPDRYELLEILDDEGFICDSSFQPFATPLSGIKGAPETPFHPVLNGRKLDLVEFPSCVLRTGRVKVPFAGGFYLRAVPYFFISWALKKVNSSRPGMIYVHPWEFDPAQPRVKVSAAVKVAQYYNLASTEEKFEKLLDDFRFVPLGEIVRNGSYPAISLDSPTAERKRSR